MCLTLKFQNQRLPKIAEKDMKVYKVLKVSLGGRLESPFRGMIYETNRLYSTKIGSINRGGLFMGWKIEMGLHSLVDISEANQMKKMFAEECRIFIAKIPKFSEYYLGDEGDIVSNNLIVSDQVYIENPNFFQKIRLWWKFFTL